MRSKRRILPVEGGSLECMEQEGSVMFDEQPDGDLHGECAAEIARLQELVRWAYSKLVYRSFDSLEDALKMDEMKLLLEHGL
jgi:hypothetical protein